jgi:hypothetical protein
VIDAKTAQMLKSLSARGVAARLLDFVSVVDLLDQTKVSIGKDGELIVWLSSNCRFG